MRRIILKILRKRYARCHECHDFSNVKSECPNMKRDLSKAMNATLIDVEFISDNQSKLSSHDETKKYMAFISVVNSESLEDKEKFDASREQSKDDRDIYKPLMSYFRISLG